MFLISLWRKQTKIYWSYLCIATSWLMSLWGYNSLEKCWKPVLGSFDISVVSTATGRPKIFVNHDPGYKAIDGWDNYFGWCQCTYTILSLKSLTFWIFADEILAISRKKMSKLCVAFWQTERCQILHDWNCWNVLFFPALLLSSKISSTGKNYQLLRSSSGN